MIDRRHLLVVLLLAALAGGCRLDVALDVAVDRNGGGTVTVVVGADPAALAAADTAGVDPLARLATQARERGDGRWQVSERNRDDGGREVRLQVTAADPDALRQVTVQLTRTLNGPELRVLDPLAVSVTDDQIRIDGGAALLVGDAATDTAGRSPEEATALLAEVVEYEIRVRLPGPLIDSNADRVEGTEDAPVLVWAVPAGQEQRLRAVAQRPTAPWPVLAGAAAAGALVALLLVVARRQVRGRHG